MQRVFISHKGTDSELARRVAARVQFNGISTYLDVIDDLLIKDGPDLADHLLKRMSECTQLIAVVSTTTKDSWWVPWEIGVGSEKDFLMASYSESYVQLPSYLKKWPELHSNADIDMYCSQAKTASSRMERRRSTAINQEELRRNRKADAYEFHKGLIASLRY